MEAKIVASFMSIALAGVSLNSFADASADADIVELRTSCTASDGNPVPNCFTTMAQINNWLTTVRHPSESRPTLINIGPGTFETWECSSSHVTLRGSGRDLSVIGASALGAILINDGCTNLAVQDLTLDSKATRWGVRVSNLSAHTTWTNVEIRSIAYGWDETRTGTSGTCAAGTPRGKHMWFSSRIRTTGAINSARAYTARCAESWFWGSEITADVTDSNATIAFALKADQAEIHLYGSNVRMLLPQAMQAAGYQSPDLGQFLIAAINGSPVHIHGTGLDMVHRGAGVVDMLYADLGSHFHANESAFNIHLEGGTGQVRRISGTGKIEAPYMWGQSAHPPLSLEASGVSTLVSANGGDTYIETDCPLTGDCSVGGSFPHQMVYRSQCEGLTPDEGPWFDLSTNDCRR